MDGGIAPAPSIAEATAAKTVADEILKKTLREALDVKWRSVHLPDNHGTKHVYIYIYNCIYIYNYTII